MREIFYADGLRHADMNRSAMDARHLSGNQDRFRNKGMGQRPHGNDHIAVKNACGFAGNVRVVHRHVLPFLDLAHRHIRRQQVSLEGEAAPDQETDEVVLPKLRHVRIFADQLALFINAVFRQVGGDVRAVRDRVQEPRTHVADFKQRTRFRISLTEQQEIIRQRLRQDYKIRLRVPVAHARGLSGQLPFADQFPYLCRFYLAVVHCVSPYSTLHSQ